MAAAWQSAPIVEQPERRPQQGSQPAWMRAPAVDEAPAAEEAPRGLQMPEPEVAQAQPAEPDPSRQPRGLLGVPAGGFTTEAQSAASEPQAPAETYPGWSDVVASDAFQQGDTRARHDLRQHYFRENIAPGLEGDERRQAEREFYSAPEADIRARLEGSDWGRERPSVAEYAQATPAMVAEGAVGSFAGAIEGAGLIGEQVGIVETNRQVDDAIRRLETTQANMEEALAGANDRFRDRVAGNYEAMLEKRQVELHDALTAWAEREPGQVAQWLRDRGVDLREIAQEIGPGEEFDGVYRDVAGGVGSMLSYMAPGMLAARLSAGTSAGTQMAAGLLTSSAMAGPSGVTEQYQRAIASGLPEEEAIETSMRGFPAGVIQVAPLASIIKPLPAELQGRALGQLYGILRTAGSEFVVENAGAIMQNLVEQSYNPERGTWDDTPYQGLVAGGSAAIIQAATLALTRGRGGVGGTTGRTGRPGEGEPGLQLPEAAQQAPDTTIEIDGEVTRTNVNAVNREQVAAEIEAAAQETDTDPTPAQAEAGNYRKGKVRVNGFEIAIESPRGSTRRGTAPDGTEWEIQMAHHYGDIKGTRAADGDNLDVFIGDNPAAESVFVIDQVNAEGRFDEHKVMMGFDSQEQAQQGYLANYEDGWQGLGAITEMPAEQFRAWVEEGDTTQPLALEPAESASEVQAGDPLARLITADPAGLSPQEAQARQQILSGDGYALLRDQAQAAGNTEAVSAVDRMQALDNQAAEAEGSEAARLRNEAARAYTEARAALEGQPATGLQMPETQVAEAPVTTQSDVAAAPQVVPAAPEAQAGRLPGRTETTYLPDNTPLETQFRVMDASQVQASNLPDGRANPNYDAALQPRDRSAQNLDSQIQVRRIAADLNPERLGSSPDAGSGAPIIGPDGMVESGNGRFMAIQTAYQQGRGDAYRDFVRQQAIDAGLDPAMVDAMETPVLVRERLTEIDRADLGRRANDAAAARMSPVETALADAERISVDDLMLWQPDQSGDPLAASNRDFQRRFAQRIGENEAAGMRNPRTGRPTAQMGQRMAAAVMGRAYRGTDGNPAADVVELAAEQSSQMRNLQAGLQAGAVDLALAYETGDAAAMEVVHAIVDATRIVRRARDEGISVNELVAQVDAFDGEVSPLARDMALLINTNMRSRRAMTDAFRYIGEQTRANAETHTGSMFEDAPAPTAEEITRAGFNEQQAQAEDGVAGESAGTPDDSGSARAGSAEPAVQGQAGDPQGAAEAQGVTVDAADTSAQRVEETAADRQVEAEPAPAESLTLETQTEESLAAREQEARAAEQAEAEQRRQEAERAQADRDADDFLLTGSDSAADQAMARGQDSLFRLEPPADVAARRDAIAEAIGQHPELAGVQPVARVAELPATVQITMLTQGIDPRSVRGVFVGGELYVVAENVADSAEGVRVAVHEAVGHHGVRQVLGDRLTPVMNRLYLSFPRDHEVFQQVRARYPHLDTTTPDGRQEFAEELVAHLAETNPQVNAWQRFVAQVRDLLRNLFPEVAWTENDVRALIQRSRETLVEQALADGAFVAEEGDTRFSIGEAPQQPRLSAIHNISAEGLAYADQMGGLAVPSIGVITEQAGGVEGFGEITLIGRRGLADPAREAVFSADAYTVRFPRPEFEGYSEADYRRLREQLEPYAERFDNPGVITHLRENGKDAPDASQLVSQLIRDEAAMAMYLEGQGQTVSPVMKAAEPGRFAEYLDHPAMAAWTEGDAMFEAYVASMEGDNAPMQRLAQSFEEAYLDTRLSMLREGINRETARERLLEGFDQRYMGADSKLRDGIAFEMIEELSNRRKAQRQEVDRMATAQALRDQIADEPAFKQWVEDTFVTPMGEPRIKVGRRNMPYTLENIVEAMTRERAIAGREETMTFGAGQVRAANAEQFQTLERMREAAAEQIRNPAEYEAAKAETEALLDRYRTKVSGHTTLQDYRGNPDTWEGLDGAMRAVARYLGYQRRGRAAFERALKAEKFDVAAIREESSSDAAVMRAQRQITSLEQDLAKWQDRQQKLPADDARQEQIAAQIARFEQRIAEVRAEAEGEVDIIALGMQAAEALEQTPVPYFEAKPQRAVGLDEFAGAVIPEGAPQSVREILDRNGLPYREAPADQRAQAVHDFRAELDQSGEDVLFSLGDQASRPTATEVQESLRGIGGIGQPVVVESADSLALGVALEATVSGVNPQEAVAFYHGDQLYVVAGNAQDAGEAVRATVATVTGRQGLRQTIGNRADPILRDALTAAQRHVAGRDAIRAVTAEFDHISMDHQADQMALATEVLARLSERSDPPAFVGEASQRLDALLQELYPEAGFTTGDGAGLARTSHHHLAQQQRDFGEKRAPYALPFVFTAQDGPGRGSLLEFALQVVDADGNIVSDARVDTAFQAGRKLGLGFFESATDRLRRSGSPMLVELANRTDAYFDQAEARLGIINGMLRDPLRRLKSLNPLQQRRNMRDFEAYMRHRDNGRQAQADEVAASNPAVAELAEAVDAMFDRVGTINQTVKTPQGTGMRVFDSKIGAYRKVGKINKGQFWPRAMRPEVQRVMRDPTSNPTLWHELLDALIDEGHAETRKEAAEYLRGDGGYFRSEIANDYFAGIEKARGEKLPEIFYDYRFDVVTNYARKWSSRISQVEQFGQKIGPHALDAFEQAATKARDAQTQDYLQALSDRVYNRRPTDAYHEGMALANLAATGLQLGNPGTATLNLIGGTQLNIQMFGSRRMAQAYLELATEARQVFRDGVEMGILGKDILNILRDADNRNSEYMDANSRVKEGLSKFAAGTMKWGGYTGTEQVIRATGMIAARIQLMDALKAWNQSPYSKDARTYRAFMERNGFDVAKLIREGGKGEETARYLRRMVNTPQGSYRVDMTPLYVDTPIGRFMFKYQKFGTQVSRMFWQQKLKPFMDVVSDPGASGMDRARAFLPIMQWFGWAVIGGGAVLAARGAMFGYLDPGPELEEIAKAFEDDDLASAWGMVASKAHANLIAGSAYGFFGNYIQMGLDVADQQRVKNPFEPPGLAPIDSVVELVRRYLEQGRLHATDLDQVVERNLSIYRTSKRGLAAVGRQAGVESDFVALEQVRRDLQYVRKAARRFADETGIDATRTATGRFGLSENTATNRKIVDALLIGNGAQAREIIREELRNTPPEERQARLQSIRSTVRARQPVQLGGPASEAEVLAFRRWAKKKLPPSRAELVERMIVDYERAKRQAGL